MAHLIFITATRTATGKQARLSVMTAERKTEYANLARMPRQNMTVSTNTVLAVVLARAFRALAGIASGTG